MNLPDRLHHYILRELIVGQRLQRYLDSQEALQRNFSKVSRRNGRSFIYADNDTINDALYNQDLDFLDTVDDSCLGIVKLRETPSYKLLKDIEAGKFDNLPERIRAVSDSFMTDQHFFKFHNRKGRAYFLTPAHLTNSLQSVMALGTLKADFNAIDSEGRLPMFFIARHAQNRLVIPMLCQIFNINANESGTLPEHYAKTKIADKQDMGEIEEMDADADLHRAHVMNRAVKREMDQPMPAIWDPPLIRAIKYRNLNALRGLSMLAPGHLNWNIRFQWNHMTPLIYAVMKADEAVESYREWSEIIKSSRDQNEIIPIDIRKWEAAKSLWTVKFLAAQVHLDPGLKDLTGTDAKGYAFSKQVKDVLAEGLTIRDSMKKQFTAYPSLRFTK